MKVWNEAARVVKTYHDELVEQWQKAMDSVLVYVSFRARHIFCVSDHLIRSHPRDLQGWTVLCRTYGVPGRLNTPTPTR